MIHALLGASTSKRWLTCTPSARYEERFQETQSTYADEGSAAHALAEALLLDNQIKLQKAKKNEYYNQEMQEAVEMYIDIIKERYNEALSRSRDAKMFVEQRLNFSEWVPEGFGTGDVIIIADGILEVIDLKYGQGVPVQAKDNPQLKLYALGAIRAFDMLYDVSVIRMTVIQPRLDNITTYETWTESLLNWAEDYVKPRAQLAWDGAGDYVSGEHCRFCRGKAVCRARADHNLELAKYEFVQACALDTLDIAAILARMNQLIDWVADVSEYALERAIQGTCFPGYKLVEGRSNRKYADQEKVAQKLTTEGYEETRIFKPRELLGITEMEKLVGKKKFTVLLDALIIKPPGKPVLVPESDKRPEIQSLNTANEDFKNESED